MRFRFTAEHFKDAVIFGCDSAEHCADRANALLEAEEAKCERVEIGLDGDIIGRGPEGSRYFALLWNMEKIGKEA